MTFLQFMLYGFGAAIAPRFTFAIFILGHASDTWAYALSMWCMINAFESGRQKFATGARFVVNVINHAVTGRQLIIERIIEKIVEKEKIIERVRTVTKTVVIRNMSKDDAYSCLKCLPNASREQLVDGYKEMMQRVHPDKGGSVYLATLVNQARTMLIKK
jgi:hypothetical protein